VTANETNTTGTISRNADWHDEKTLWNDIARKSPNKGRPQQQYQRTAGEKHTHTARFRYTLLGNQIRPGDRNGVGAGPRRA
jgi:myosin-crossreactive antigen